MPLQSTQDYAKVGQVYNAHSQAAVTLSGLSTTATGLILVNPFGSGKNLLVNTIVWSASTAPAGASVVGIAVSPAASATQVTLTTPLTVYNSLIGGAAVAGVGKVCSAATTVGTPVYVRALGGVVAGSSIVPDYIRDDIDGSIILTPGTSLQLAYLTTAAIGMASIQWTEYIPT